MNERENADAKNSSRASSGETGAFSGLVGPAGVNVHDYAVIGIDLTTCRIRKECWTFAGIRPLAGRVSMGGELGFDCGGGTEGRVTMGIDILTYCSWRGFRVIVPGDRHLEHMAQQVALAEPARPVLRNGDVIRKATPQIKMA